MLYQIGIASFFLYQIKIAYLSVTVVTSVTYHARVNPKNIRLKGASIPLEGSMY